MSWNLDRTRLLVKQLYGEDQLDLAENSLHSIHRRKLMARYHWQEFKLLHEKRMQRFHESVHPMIAFLDEFGRGTGAHGIATQAHLLGCLQNLHAMADTFDFAVYYLLKLGSPIDPRSITGSFVSKALTKDPKYGAVLKASNVLRKGGNFVHLDALVNHAKHRSIINVPFSVDASGEDPNPYRFEFEAFSFGSVDYDRTEVLPFVGTEGDRCFAQILVAGNAVNDVLELEAASSSP